MKHYLATFSIAVSLMSCLGDAIQSKGEFGDSIIASLAAGSSEYVHRLPAEAQEALTNAREDLTGDFSRVLTDETWGVVELGYCFATGAFVSLTLPTHREPAEELDIHVYTVGSHSADRCAARGAAA